MKKMSCIQLLFLKKRFVLKKGFITFFIVLKSSYPREFYQYYGNLHRLKRDNREYNNHVSEKELIGFMTLEISALEFDVSCKALRLWGKSNNIPQLC